MRVVDLEILSDELEPRGFLSVRRVEVRNVRADGSHSRAYAYEFLERPKGQDAVVVVAWCRRDGDVHVLIREQLRPPVYVARKDDRQLLLRECVAGIVEQDDGSDLRHRAATELEEEAGIRVPASALRPLGEPMFPSPGAMSERLFFFEVEVDPATAAEPKGDGSPAEEGSVVHWLPIARALEGVTDLKTEVGVRRLRERSSG
jgi:ADP-ribose pyrophosphatase